MNASDTSTTPGSTESSTGSSTAATEDSSGARRVLHLAFGPYRVRAAAAQTAALAESGAQVLLLVADRPEWDELPVHPGVELRRVSRAGGRGPLPGAVEFWRRARSAVDAALAELDPDLLVAGDAHAVPAAYHASRQRPELTVVHEPLGLIGGPGARGGFAGAPAGLAAPAAAGIRHLAVVTPWYPSPNNPFAGDFVRAATHAAAPYAHGISILHTEDWTGPAGGLAADVVRTAADRLPVSIGQESGLLRVPVPVFPNTSYADQAEAKVRALARVLPGGVIDADVVHGHVGIFGGLVAARLARSGARVVVTEHATFLHRVLKQPRARELYREVLERADAFLCVGEQLRSQLLGYFPEFADRIAVLPNAVDFGAIPAAARPGPELARWLYVGRLIEQKNPAVLVEAFAVVARENPAATLTLVGSGPLEGPLRARVAALGLTDRVEFTGGIPHEEVVRRMHEAELLVHASRAETFGMTLVEAVAAGLPVLATRSGGPEETMAGLDGVAGTLVEVGDDPGLLLAGYRRLREGFDRLDLPAARERLRARYGAEAVGARLGAVYGVPGVTVPPKPAGAEAEAGAGTDYGTAAGAAAREAGAVAESATGSARAVDAAAAPAAAVEPAAAADAPAAARGGGPLREVVVGEGDAPASVLLLALNHPAPRRVIAYAHWLIARGVRVTLVSVQGAHWRGLGLDPRVEIRTLRDAEGRHPLPRGERVIVNRAPRAVIRRARAKVEGRPETRPLELAVGVVERAHLRAGDVFHRKVFLRGYRVLRPYLLAQVSDQALNGLDVAGQDLIVAADSNAITLGWRLARRYPDVPATTAMDREPFAHREVTDPWIDPEGKAENADIPPAPGAAAAAAAAEKKDADAAALVAAGTAAPGLEG
ncbi:glycosyltransferase [Phaeacidiphilus oryzae]|uniref:glycosyltransferase n=1 Tax=Phaeacidiphilus oryzae TaxID=348818 RepID=UPI00068C0D7E|nr:glycosyltransferase [Phaeacidiphilus oryzae]